MSHALKPSLRVGDRRPLNFSISPDKARCIEHLRSLARLGFQPPDLRRLLSFLVPHLSPSRPLWLFEPHNDDGLFKSGGTIVDIVGLGLPVEHAVVFSGERSPGWPRNMTLTQRKTVRDDELQTMVDIMGTKAVRLYVPCYHKKYWYTEEDLDIVCTQLTKRTPGAIICPAEDDLHEAHRAARSLLASAMRLLELDLPVISYSAVWGSLVPNAYHLFSQSTADVKYLGCRAHGSQQLAADYLEYVRATLRREPEIK